MADVYLNLFMLNYIHRTNDRSIILSKAVFTPRSILRPTLQFSSTSILLYSCTMLLAEPIIFDLTQRTRLSILESNCMLELKFMGGCNGNFQIVPVDIGGYRTVSPQEKFSRLLAALRFYRFYNFIPASGE